jgi:hypothetical protein
MNNIQSKKDQDFHQTLRLYSERLNEEKEKSLSYLHRISEMTEECIRKDNEITRLNRANH